MTDSEIHDLAAKLHQIEQYSVALEYASEIARLRDESDEDDQEIKRLALENTRLCNDLKRAAELLRQTSTYPQGRSLRIAIDDLVAQFDKTPT